VRQSRGEWFLSGGGFDEKSFASSCRRDGMLRTEKQSVCKAYGNNPTSRELNVY